MHCVFTLVWIILNQAATVVHADCIDLFASKYPKKVVGGILFSAEPSNGNNYDHAITECASKNTPGRHPGRLALINSEAKLHHINGYVIAVFGITFDQCELKVGGYTNSSKDYVGFDAITELKSQENKYCLMLSNYKDANASDLAFNLFSKRCDYPHAALFLCEEIPSYVLIPASITINLAFRLDYVDLVHADSAQIMQNVITALKPEFSGSNERTGIDGFQFITVTLLRKVNNNVGVDFMVGFMPAEITDGDIIQKAVTKSLEYFVLTGVVGPYRFPYNMMGTFSGGQGVFMVKEYILNDIPKTSTDKYAYAEINVGVEMEYTFAFTDFLNEETQRITSPIEKQLKYKLKAKLAGFDFLQTLLVKREPVTNGTRTSVFLVVFALTREENFNGAVFQEAVNSAHIAAVSSGLIQAALSASLFFLNSNVSKPTIVPIYYPALPSTTEKHVFTPSSFLLGVEFQPIFSNITQAVTVNLIRNLEQPLNARLIELNNAPLQGFQTSHVTLLRNVDTLIGVDVVIVSLAIDLTYDASLIQRNVQSVLETIFSAGTLGSFDIKRLPSGNMADVGLTVKEYNIAENVSLSGKTMWDSADVLVPAPVNNSNQASKMKYVLIPASITIDLAFKLAYIDLVNADSAQIIQNVVTALEPEFSGSNERTGIDGFLFTNVTLLRKVNNYVGVDFMVVSQKTSDIIQKPVTRSLEYLVLTGVLGPYGFPPNMMGASNGGQGVFMVKEYILSDVPEISTEKYAFVQMHMGVQKDYTFAFTDLLNEETQRIKSAIEKELAPQLESKLAGFQFLETLIFRREPDGILTSVFLAAFSLTKEETFDATEVKGAANIAYNLAVNSGLIQAAVSSPLFFCAENVSKSEMKFPSMTETIDKHVFTPSSFLLDEVFQLKFLNLTYADTAKLISSLELVLNEKLRKLDGKPLIGFQIFQVTSLRKIDNEVGVDAVIVSLTTDATFIASRIQGDVESLLKSIFSIGTLGPFTVKPFPDGSVVQVQTTVRENPIPVNKFFLTPITLLLGKEFKVEFLNRSHPNTNFTIYNVETMLNELFLNKVDGFEFLYVTSLRKVETNIGADINVVSLTSEETFDSSLVIASVEKLLTQAANTGALEPYKMQLLRGINVDANLFIREYVFTPSSFLLEKEFSLEFLNLTHADSAYLTNNIEESLNKQLAGKIDGFHFVYVTLLRKVKHNVGVNLTVVSMTSKEEFNTGLTRTSVDSALMKVLSTGVLGPFFVVYTGQKDFQVQQPFLGPAPAFVVQKHVFTLVSILVEKEFHLNYIIVDNIETQALTIGIKAELEKQLNSMLDQFPLLQVALVRPEKEGRTFVDLNVMSVTTPQTFVMTTVEQTVKSAVKATIKSGNLGVQIDSASPGSYSVKTLPLGGIPSVYTDYAVTRVSLKLAVQFVFAFANKESNETRQLKMQTENELRQFLMYVDKFQFAKVVLLRDDAKHTWIDINIGVLTSEESFDAEALHQTITDVLQMAIKDGDLGGYEVDTVSLTKLVVNTPKLGSFPPPQEYAFTGASMQLEEPWKKVYRDLGHPETEKLIFQTEQELKNAFNEEGDNIEVELIDLRSVAEKVSLEFEVASLTIVDEFNSTVMEATLINAIDHAVQDGDIGGFRVNPNVAEAVKLEKFQLGKPPAFIRDATIKENAGALTPGTPAFIVTIVIACCCIVGTVFLVTSMVAVIKKREQMEKRKQQEKTSYNTGDTSIGTGKETSVNKSSSSCSSSSTP